MKKLIAIVSALVAATGSWYIIKYRAKREQEKAKQAQIAALMINLQEAGVCFSQNIPEIAQQILSLDPTHFEAFLYLELYKHDHEFIPATEAQEYVQKNIRSLKTKTNMVDVFDHLIKWCGEEQPFIFLFAVKLLCSKNFGKTNDEMAVLNRYLDAIIAHPKANHILISNAWSLKAMNCVSEKNIQNMTTYSMIALSKYPKNIHALIALCQHYDMVQQDYQQVMDHAQKIIDIDEKSSHGYFYYAKALHCCGRLQEAQQMLESNLTKVNNAINYYELLAMIYLKKGNIKQAMVLCDFCIQKLKDQVYWLTQAYELKIHIFLSMLLFDEVLNEINYAYVILKPSDAKLFHQEWILCTNMKKIVNSNQQLMKLVQECKKTNTYPFVKDNVKEILSAIKMPQRYAALLTPSEYSYCFGMVGLAFCLTTSGTMRHTIDWLVPPYTILEYFALPEYKLIFYACSNLYAAYLVVEAINQKHALFQEFFTPKTAAQFEQWYMESQEKNADFRDIVIEKLPKMQ